jgi:hypothetical protein
MTFTKSEKKIINKIKKAQPCVDAERYMFWFVYDDNDEAIDYEGGYDLPLSHNFRNQYSIGSDRKIVKNW